MRIRVAGNQITRTVDAPATRPADKNLSAKEKLSSFLRTHSTLAPAPETELSWAALMNKRNREMFG
jgi:hypothetical protein